MGELMGNISDEVYNSMEKKMNSESKKKQGETPWISPTIFKVPESLRKLNPSAYTPRVVSIGPLHQKDPRLIRMQDQKLSYMHSLLDRTAKSYTPICSGESVDAIVKNDAIVKSILRECVEAIVEKTRDARTCYEGILKEDEYSDVELANTLLVDGCFILEFLLRCKRKEIGKIIDPVFINNLALGGIRHDLLLLENQIPFFVLEKLFQLTLEKIEGLNLPLTQYVIQFFGEMMNLERKMKVKNGTTETCDHILGLYHKLYEPASNGREPGDYGVVKYSATQIHSAGVQFKASGGEEYLFVRFQTSCLMFSLHQMVRSWLWQKPTNSDLERNEVKVDLPPSAEPKAVGAAEERSHHQKPSNCFFFSFLQPADRTARAEPRELQPVKKRNNQSSPQTSSICSRLSTLLPQYLFSWLFYLCSTTYLELPPLCIFDHTESFLRNLIAYEQCCLTVPHYITSYAFLMDTLINSKEDVELLEDEGVLQNYLGASEDASALFNNLCKEIFSQKFYFSDQWKEMDDYCNRYWPKHLASLRRSYFSNPWAFISLIGALLLFGLTAAQTAYTIK